VIGAIAPILPSRRTARLCAAILDRRDTVPAPPFSTAVNMPLYSRLTMVWSMMPTIDVVLTGLDFLYQGI